MRVASLIVSLALLAGCAPKLTFVSSQDLDKGELWARSTHVFLGVIENQVFPFYPFFRHPGDDAGYMRILRRRIRVEAVLKGSEPRPYIYVYEIFWTGGASGDWNFTQTNTRYVIPVRIEDRVYHVSGDWRRSIFPIHSGRHTRLPLDASHPIELRIALLDLWPAAGHDPHFPPKFARLEPDDSYPWRKAKLLRGMLLHPEASIRRQACAVLVRLELAQDECLPSITLTALNEDGYIPPAQEVLNQNRRFEQRARSEWSYIVRRVEKFPETMSCLRLFTTVRDDALRTHFCREFVRLFPGDTDHGCPADRPRPATIVTEAGDIPLTGPWPTR